MKKAEKIEKAKEVLQAAKQHGCKTEISGNFVKFTPPLPIEVLLAASDVSDEIFELVRTSI